MRDFVRAALAVLLWSLGPAILPPSLAAEGVVNVYLQALPQEAAGLEFRPKSLSAIREEGGSVPLTLRLKSVGGPEFGRERLLASGRLPPGRYSGLSLEVASATLKQEDGPAELTLKEEPTKISAPFVLKKDRGIVLSLRLHHKEVSTEDPGFAPALSGEIPPVSATGLLGLATSGKTDTVLVFDKATGRALTVIPTGRGPQGMALNQERHRAYIANTAGNAIEAIDLLETAVVDRVQLRGGDAPSEVALTFDGTVLLSVNTGSDTVSFIDPGALFEVDRIAVGRKPSSVLIDRTGQRAYAFNTESDTVSIIDVPGRTVLATLATQSGPYRGAFNKAGDRLYIIHRTGPHVTIVDPGSLSAAGKVYVGTGATALVVDPRTDRIYIARRGTGMIEVFDPFSLLPVDSIRTGEDVSYLAVDPDQNKLHLVLPQANLLRTVGLVGGKPATELDVTAPPYWVTFMGER